MPTAFGEKLVMRIFDPEVLVRNYRELGFSERDDEVWNAMISQPNGIILVTGPTGSGKTTLLNAMGGLDTPDSGRIRVGDIQVDELGKGTLADMRLHKIGFVFQAYNLIPVLTAYENAESVMALQGTPAKERHDRVMALLRDVGLEGMEHRRPHEMSGGQQQRVAIARALAHRPQLVFADEPTGNLHDTLSRQIMELLARLVDESGCSLLLVTHSRRTAAFARRRLLLKAGTLHAQE